MPQKPHVPTEGFRQIVQAHTMVGTPQDQIATILGVSDRTLRKHYRDELDLGKAKANAVAVGKLFKKVQDGNLTAIIFWLKTQAGFRETNNLEVTGADRGPVETAKLSKKQYEEIRREMLNDSDC